MGYKEILGLISGLAMFLFGMNVMGQALEKRAGNKLKSILGSMTSNTFKGFMLGFFVTLIIQSSSATTVMVVGFVNSGLMTLRQSIGVIMGANLGTSITAWILSLQGIEGTGILTLFKPATFTPILALIGIIFYMFQKNPKRKDTGLILLGFAVLMFGMDTMSDAVSALEENEAFRNVLVMFSNPILGVLAGTIVTAIVQSSSASVGILQALTKTGAITFNTAVPIIMGQNIGTCVTAMISSVGASKNARRAAIIHLSFNVIATLLLLPIYYLLVTVLPDTVTGIVYTSSGPLGIAVVHTAFKFVALLILMPCSGLLEKLARAIVKDGKGEQQLLDERLLATPAVAVERCRVESRNMAELAVSSLKSSFSLLDDYDEKKALEIKEEENKVDTYEDKLGSYLVKLSAKELTPADSAEVSKLLHIIGDFERISDHAMNIVGSSEEMHDKGISFSEDARRELSVMIGAIEEILDLSLEAFCKRDLDAAVKIEPLEEVIDVLKEEIKRKHIARLQKNECTIEMGFILTDVLTSLERISDHCSNIGGCVLGMQHRELDIHEYLRRVKTGEDKEFTAHYDFYKVKYAL